MSPVPLVIRPESEVDVQGGVSQRQRHGFRLTEPRPASAQPCTSYRALDRSLAAATQFSTTEKYLATPAAPTSKGFATSAPLRFAAV